MILPSKYKIRFLYRRHPQRSKIEVGGDGFFIQGFCHFYIDKFLPTKLLSVAPKIQTRFKSSNMRCLIAPLLFGLQASALLIPRTDDCTFEMGASGGCTGCIGQLPDGQNRCGGKYAAASYIMSNGKIRDASGRGCIVTRTSSSRGRRQSRIR